jgi:hypothetical protein
VVPRAGLDGCAKSRLHRDSILGPSRPQRVAILIALYTRWFKYDRYYLCVNKSQFVPVIFEPPCILYSSCLVFKFLT